MSQGQSLKGYTPKQKMSTSARRRLMRDFKVRPILSVLYSTLGLIREPCTAHADGSPRWGFSIAYRRQRDDLVCSIFI